MIKPTRLLLSAEKPILVRVIEAQDARLTGQGYRNVSPKHAIDLPERSLQHQRH